MNKPFIKYLNTKKYELHTLHRKKSFDNISNRNHFISKSIYLYGIIQNKNKILDPFEVMKFQKTHNKNYLKISLLYWFLFFSFFYLDRTL